MNPSNKLFKLIKKTITLFRVVCEMMPLNILSFRECLLALEQGTTRDGLYACHLILYARQSKLMQVHYPPRYKLQKL